MSILDLIRTKKTATPDAPSAEIEAALDAVFAELPAARKASDAAGEFRDELTLDGTDAEREAAEREADRLDRIWRDLDVARVKLTERLEAARKREKRAEHEALAREARSTVDRQEKILVEAARLTSSLITLAEEYTSLDAVTRQARDVLRAADVPDLMPETVLARATERGWANRADTPMTGSHGFPRGFLGAPGGFHRDLVAAGAALARTKR